MKYSAALSDVLYQLLNYHRIKPTELARVTGVSQPTIQRILSGTTTRPHESSLLAIARYFSISLAQLKGEQPIPELVNQWPAFKQLPLSEAPLLNWTEVYEWLSQEQLNIQPSQTIFTEHKLSENSFALKIQDSSMAPTFPQDTVLIFDPQKSYKDRGYVLAYLEGTKQPLFRQLIIDGEALFIRPLNPDLSHFRIQMLASPHHICATLVQARQDF